MASQFSRRLFLSKGDAVDDAQTHMTHRWTFTSPVLLIDAVSSEGFTYSYPQP